MQILQLRQHSGFSLPSDLLSRTGRGDGNKPRRGVTEARGNPKSKIRQ